MRAEESSIQQSNGTLGGATTTFGNGRCPELHQTLSVFRGQQGAKQTVDRIGVGPIQQIFKLCVAENRINFRLQPSLARPARELGASEARRIIGYSDILQDGL